MLKLLHLVPNSAQTNSQLHTTHNTQPYGKTAGKRAPIQLIKIILDSLPLVEYY